MPSYLQVERLSKSYGPKVCGEECPSIQSSMLLVFMYLFYSLAELYKFCIIWQVNGRVFSSSQITISEIWNYVIKTLCLRSIINIGYEICR